MAFGLSDSCEADVKVKTPGGVMVRHHVTNFGPSSRVARRHHYRNDLSTCKIEEQAHSRLPLPGFVVIKSRGQAHRQILAKHSEWHNREDLIAEDSDVPGFAIHNRMFSFNPLSSFRSQMVLLIAAMLLVTTGALQIINQRLQARVTRQVEAHIEEITVAIDVTLRSRQSKSWLYEFVREDGRLVVSPDSVVHSIFVTEENKGGIIVDSTIPDPAGKSQPQDLDQPLPESIRNLPPVRQGDLIRDADGKAPERTLTLPLETDKGRRKIIIVVSLSRLARTVREASRDRLLATVSLGLLMTLLVAIFSHRFSRPVTELAKAAQKVAAGDLDFQVLVLRRDEVGKLAETFNEMLFGLRNKRELEEQLQRAERSAVVGRLASGIAHEIRNPLNFINLSIDHLKEKFAPSAKPLPNLEAARTEYTHLLVTIKDEIARLNSLVSNFLSYGRPSKLRLRDVDARTLVTEVMTLVQAQADQQGVKLVVEESPASNGDHHVQADVEQIKTCFSNLIINAVQAMPDGGRLTVTLDSNEGNLHIIFADSGCGITPEAVEQIFEPYYSTKETGIGLGLPLTKKLIEDHGGTISVISEVGAGTTFIVTLLHEPMV